MASLITGASGFLGGRLAQMLHERGEEIIVLARATSSLKHLDGIPLRIVRGDLNDTAALRAAVTSATYIFHCAACSTDWASPQTYAAANITGTENLLASAVEAPGLKRFLHVSTTDVYGYPETPCPEESPVLDAGLPYNRTKGEGELAAWKAHREKGVPVTLVRPATIYGPRGKDFTVEIAKLLRQRIMLLISGGAAPGGFTYVDNVAEAMIAAADSPRTLGQAYNIADGSGATWHQYLTLFAEQLGLRPPWIDLPFSAAMALARTMEAPHRYLRTPGRPLLTRHAVYLLGRNQEFPIAKAKADFGFAPKVGIEEGVRRSAVWLQSTPTT